jgi:hypothetical protein
MADLARIFGVSLAIQRHPRLKASAEVQTPINPYCLSRLNAIISLSQINQTESARRLR